MVFYISLYNNGFHTVSELINSQGIFFTHENITNDFLVKLPFTVFEEHKHYNLCAFPEVKYLDPHSIKRPLRPKLTEILLKDKKESRRIYDGFMSQIQQKQLCQKMV